MLTDELLSWIQNKFLIVSVNPNANHVHFYIEAGKIETNPLLTANRRLYKGLKEKRYKTTYEEFKGGHDRVWWREKLPGGLRALKYSKTTL